MITVAQGGVQVREGAIETLKAQYQANGYALLPGFIAPSLLPPLLKRVSLGQFDFREEALVKGSTQLMPQTDPALISLHFMLNRPALFDAVSKIADIPRPGNFLSRLHKTTSSPGEELDWHDDGTDGRLLGLNVNLSTEPYSGGVLQMRNPEKNITGEIGQLPPGDAFLFRIANKWQHRLTPVNAGARTVAVGWFRSKPDWTALAFRGLRSSLHSGILEAR